MLSPRYATLQYAMPHYNTLCHITIPKVTLIPHIYHFFHSFCQNHCTQGYQMGVGVLLNIAPIHTPDEIHHGKRCIHVTLDNSYFILIKMCFNSFICKVKKCPVCNALSMFCLQRTVNYPPRSFLNILGENFSQFIYLWHLGINMQRIIS